VPPLQPTDRTGAREPGRRGPRRERAVLVLLLAALAWVGYGLAVETLGLRQALAARAAGADPARGVIASWQPGDPGPRRLERFLDVLEYYLPDGARVAVVAPGKPAGEEHFTALWAAYFLPRQRIPPRAGALGPEGTDPPVDYAISWELPVDDPRLVEVLRHPDGGLYRVER